jgi:hypothetical protein
MAQGNIKQLNHIHYYKKPTGYRQVCSWCDKSLRRGVKIVSVIGAGKNYPSVSYYHLDCFIKGLRRLKIL